MGVMFKALRCFIYWWWVRLIWGNDEPLTEFKNDCDGWDNQRNWWEADDCLGISEAAPFKCCFIQGQVGLDLDQACVKVEQTQEKRIEKILEHQAFATRVSWNCGEKKVLPHNCSMNNKNPKEAEDCYKDHNVGSGKKCCFWQWESSQFNGTTCMVFPKLDINTIGEAVVAAKTINANWNVNCNGHYLHLSYVIVIGLSVLVWIMN